MIQLFRIIMAAGESREVALAGSYFELRNAIGEVALVELLDRSGGVIARLEELEQSDFVKPGQFETVRITNGLTAQTLRFFVGSGDAGSRRTSGQVVVTDAPVSGLQDNSAVAVTDAGASMVAGSAVRRRLVFTNIGLDPVAIGFTGITWAKRCIILNADDTWVEDRAANLAWAAICDAGKTASVTVQEVLV